MFTLNNPKVENYAHLLKQARIHAGLTQKALADGLGISIVMVGRYETDAARPSEKTALTIHRFFSDLNQETQITPTTQPEKNLTDYSLDELLAEIKRRGFKVSLESLI